MITSDDAGRRSKVREPSGGPNLDLQIEVFDPKPGTARELVESDRITPVVAQSP